MDLFHFFRKMITNHFQQLFSKLSPISIIEDRKLIPSLLGELSFHLQTLSFCKFFKLALTPDFTKPIELLKIKDCSSFLNLANIKLLNQFFQRIDFTSPSRIPTEEGDEVDEFCRLIALGDVVFDSDIPLTLESFERSSLRIKGK